MFQTVLHLLSATALLHKSSLDMYFSTTVMLASFCCLGCKPLFIDSFRGLGSNKTILSHVCMIKLKYNVPPSCLHDNPEGIYIPFNRLQNLFQCWSVSNYSQSSCLGKSNLVLASVLLHYLESFDSSLATFCLYTLVLWFSLLQCMQRWMLNGRLLHNKNNRGRLKAWLCIRSCLPFFLVWFLTLFPTWLDILRCLVHAFLSALLACVVFYFVSHVVGHLVVFVNPSGLPVLCWMIDLSLELPSCTFFHLLSCWDWTFFRMLPTRQRFLTFFINPLVNCLISSFMFGTIEV